MTDYCGTHAAAVVLGGIVFAGVILLEAQAFAQGDPALAARAAGIMKIAKEKNVSAAVGEIEKADLPQAVNLYMMLVNRAYQGEKDLVLMNALGRAGVKFLQSKADGAADAAMKTKLKSAAMALTYNLAANNWPGWGEVGIMCDDAALAAGLEFAQLHAKLCAELKGDDEKQANSHWVLGASLLALKKFDEAVKEFDASATSFKAAKNSDSEWMAIGYSGLTAQLAGEPFGNLDEAKKALVKSGTEDAKFFIEQLDKASQVFTKRFAK